MTDEGARLKCNLEHPVNLHQRNTHIAKIEAQQSPKISHPLKEKQYDT